MNDTERNNQILKAVSSIPIEKEGADLTLVPALLKEQLQRRIRPEFQPEWEGWNAYVLARAL